MTVQAVNHINLRAPAALLEEIRHFYCDVVGLREGHRPDFGSHGYWLYAGEQPIVHLSLAQPGDGRERGSVSTYDHVAFTCSGRQACEARLNRMGLAYQSAHLADLGLRVLVLKDPAGNGVELDFPEVEAA